VGADNATNTAGFPGQVFFNPTAGDVGSLEILSFDGPAAWSVDAAVSKNFRFAGRYRFEIRAEFLNAFNTVTFYSGDQNVNSTSFGRVTQTNTGPRVIQLSGRLSF
jgi:hypothetical protein